MKIFDAVGALRPKLNSFNLTHERKMSFNMGHLIPTYVQEVVPGDRFRVKSEMMLRFAPMLAPIMHRVNIYTHYFFVPNRIIWNEWEDFITGGEDGNASPVWPHYQWNSAIWFAKSSLADYLGLPVYSDQANSGISVSALPFRAYQEIYNEYYRDQNLEEAFDYGKGSGTQGASIAALGLRQRAWEKDYFTSCLPWAQRGSEALIPMRITDDNITYKDPALVAPGAGPGDLEADAQDQIGIQGGDNTYIDNIAEITNATATINDLRKSVKLQEWLERSARGGARYIEQILQHFGVRSSDKRLQRPEFLGGGKQNVVISEVLNNTGTEDAPQGDMAGHGIAVGVNNTFKKRFEEHGFIMGITSVIPRTAYQQGVNRMWSREDKFDYYWREFANIGEQEVLNKELYADGDPDDNQATFGYQSRYAEYKYQPDSVHGDFRDTLDHWHIGRKFSNRPNLNANFVQMFGSDANRIFAVSEGDNLYLQCLNHVSALRPMPYLGTPSF